MTQYDSKKLTGNVSSLPACSNIVQITFKYIDAEPVSTSTFTSSTFLASKINMGSPPMDTSLLDCLKIFLTNLTLELFGRFLY